MTLPALHWKPSPNFSSRHAKISLIVVHDTEGGYEGAIATFANHHSQVSAHLVLKEDGSEATQMVKFGDKAWHVCAFNSVAIGLEMAGFLAKGYAVAEWGAAHEIVAYLAHRFEVPLRWSRDGHTPGICRHRDLGRAGGGHSDPCDDVTWAKFMDAVQAVRADWPLDPWGAT